MNTICDYCGKEFDAKKETALYCSNSHRTLANKQRRKDELAKVEIEKQRIQALERRKQIADEKQKKWEQEAESERQEQEKQIEIVRLSEENKRIQDEIEAAVLADKNHKDEEDRQTLKEKQEADIKQRLADKLGKSIADRQKFEKELRDAEKQGILFGKLIYETVKKLKGSYHQSGNALPPMQLNSTNADLKPINLTGLWGQIGPGTTKDPGVTSQTQKIMPAPPDKVPGHKSITGDFLEMVDNIF